MWAVTYRKVNERVMNVKYFSTEAEAKLWADAMMADGYLCKVAKKA